MDESQVIVATGVTQQANDKQQVKPLVAEIKKLTKAAFDIEAIISTASYLKYTRELKRILTEELSSPSDEFVKFFASQVYSGRLTQSVLTQFTDTVKDAFNQFINEES